MGNYFDQDYYEQGIESGKSCYQNYRWMPEATMSMAMAMIDYLPLKKTDIILDYGCAKGYLVKALRLLHRDAEGVDISEYAISHCDEEVKEFCKQLTYKFQYTRKYTWTIAKDVFEHISHATIGTVIKTLPSMNLFVVVPLGKRGKYVAPANNFDQSHVICENMEWWKNKLNLCGWEVVDMTYRIDGIKDTYQAKYPKSHGFFKARRV